MKKPKPLVEAVRIEGGKIILPNRAVFAAAIRHWPDMAADLELRPFEETRRGRANRYYWGVVLKLIATESGYSVDDLHELFKLRHNAKATIDPVSGEETHIGQSTTKLSVGEFSVYLERVMLDGAEVYGMTFPEPRASEEYR